MNKKSRERRKQLKNRSKKRKGGMFSAANANAKAKSMKLVRNLEGVDPELKELLRTIPGSGSHAHVASQLLRPLETAPRNLQARAASAITSLSASSAVAQGLGIQLFKRAQKMRAHSFRDHDVAKCAEINQKAEKLLKDATDLGNLQARAALAEMYLSRDKVGVKPPITEHVPMAVDLVSEFDSDDSDPDCMGVLAYCHFKYNMLNEAAPLAMKSAQSGSKYGQFVCGLIQRNQHNNGIHNHGACHWFSLAASQNYDEAQIGLAELYSSGKMTMGGTKEEDMREALRLRELAAEQGNNKAMLFIGYTHGDEAIALKKDENRQEEAQQRFEEACRWIGFALESKNDSAERALIIIKREFEDVRPKRSKK
jgi:TPR repeat protein